MKSGRSNYWRLTLLVTGGLLLLWAAVTVPSIWFAADLNRLRFLGWPVGYYMAAQGTLLVYLAIVGFYGWYMDRLDRNPPADEPPSP